MLCAALRLPLPRGRVLGLVVLYGLLGFAAAYGCLYWALQEVPAGIGAVVLAVGPLLMLLLAVAHGMERFSGRALAGALVALVGSVVIFFQPSEIAFGWGSLVLLASRRCAASESVVISKRVGRQHPVAMNFVGMTAGAAALLVASVVAGERLALPAEGETQLALVYLVVATVGLFLVRAGRRPALDGVVDRVHLRADADRRRRAGIARRRRADHADDGARRWRRVRGRLSRRGDAPQPTGYVVIPFEQRAVGYRVGRARGIVPAGRIDHEAGKLSYTPGVRRSMVVRDSVLTVSDAGVKSSSLATLAERGWAAFPPAEPPKPQPVP